MSDWVCGNLDFEYELAEPNRYQRPPAVARTVREWSQLLRLLPGMEKAEELDLSQPPPRADRVEVWGVTPSVQRVLEALGQPTPFWETVRRVNDKRFSHALECELGVALPGSAVVTTPEELEQVVEQCPGDWVLKHPFGVSGRERLMGREGRLSDSVRGWARRQFGKGWSLLFEPWVEGREDFSSHYQIKPDGSVLYAGECELLSDRGGVYRGSRVTDLNSPEVKVVTDKVVASLVEQGYWGPVGIDGFRGHLRGRPITRPLVEINARYSFGRIALELHQRLPAGWCLSWLHPKVPQAEALEPLPSDPAGGRYRLPEEVNGSGALRTILLVSPTLERLEELEASYQVPGDSGDCGS